MPLEPSVGVRCILYKSDEEIEVMLSHPNNHARVALLGKGNHFKRDTPHKVHEFRTVEEKSNIAVLGTLIGNKATGEMMGIDPGRVGNYKNGSDGNGRMNPSLAKENGSRLDSIRTRALDKVELFMEMLTTEKALKMKGRDMASAAEKFVNVFERLGPKVPVSDRGINIVFFAPKIKEGSEYPVIEVEASENAS